MSFQLHPTRKDGSPLFSAEGHFRHLCQMASRSRASTRQNEPQRLFILLSSFLSKKCTNSYIMCLFNLDYSAATLLAQTNCISGTLGGGTGSWLAVTLAVVIAND